MVGQCVPEATSWFPISLLGHFHKSNCKLIAFKDLNANLANLTAEFEKATAEKIKCQQEADATNRVISLANRYRVVQGVPCCLDLFPLCVPYFIRSQTAFIQKIYK